MICFKRLLVLLLLLVSCQLTVVYSQTWPTPRPEAKAGTRWWWLGSAVDRKGLEWNLTEYAKAGIGAVEITPLYGVQGNEKNELSFLTSPWMKALKDVEEIPRNHTTSMLPVSSLKSPVARVALGAPTSLMLEMVPTN